MQAPAYEPMELGVNCMVQRDVSWAWKKVICISAVVVILVLPMSMDEDVDEGIAELMVIELMSISVMKL